jgi:hypothetical protein
MIPFVRRIAVKVSKMTKIRLDINNYEYKYTSLTDHFTSHAFFCQNISYHQCSEEVTTEDCEHHIPTKHEKDRIASYDERSTSLIKWCC